MSTITRSAPLALAKDSRLLMSSWAGARLRVNATPSATTVVVTSATELTGTTLYSGTHPGMLVCLSVAAGSANNGKTANVTAVSGSSLTVDVDFSAVLAAGDIIAVLPPISVELFLSGGHTLQAVLNNDYTMGLTETFDTQNTPMGVDVNGDITVFQIPNSQGLVRILATGIGAYKLSGGSHIYRPDQANDGTFTAMQDSSYMVQDGNGVIRRAMHGFFGTKLVLNFPEGARSTATLSLLGNGSVREITGTGKTFPSGASKYIVSPLACDTGAGMTFRSAFIDLGGAFGNALSATPQPAIKNMTITIEKGAISDRTLGDPYLVKPAEQFVRLTATGTRILMDNTFELDADGQATDADPGNSFKTETRMLIKAILPNDPTKTLSLDIPRGVFSSVKSRRQPGRFYEDFEYRSLATLDGNGCVSTTTPPLQATLVSSYVNDISITV